MLVRSQPHSIQADGCGLLPRRGGIELDVEPAIIASQPNEWGSKLVCFVAVLCPSVRSIGLRMCELDSWIRDRDISIALKVCC